MLIDPKYTKLEALQKTHWQNPKIGIDSLKQEAKLRNYYKILLACVCPELRTWVAQPSYKAYS